MATYAELLDLASSSSIVGLRKRIVMAVLVKANIVAKAATPTAAAIIMWTKSIDGIEIVEYKPVRPVQHPLLRMLPLHVILFHGRLRRGVGEEE